MSSLRRSVPFIAAAAVSLAAQSGCTLLLDRFEVPDRVRAGTVFEVLVEATSDGGYGDAGVAAVLQIPDDFEFLEHWNSPALGTVPAVLDLDDPALLALYTAEPGHRLVSFSNTDPAFSPSPPLNLRVRLRAPAARSTVLKVSLAVLRGGLWTAEVPSGTTSFASIQGASAAALQVLPAPLVGSTAWEDRSVGLPVFAGGLQGPDHGDVDGDGLLDLALGPYLGVTPRVFLRRGADWEDASPAPLSNVAARSDARFGHFDADGRLDLASSGAAWLGDGRGGWTPSSAGLAPSGLVGPMDVGDVNGDGLDDLALGGPTYLSQANLQVFLAQGDGTWLEASEGLPSAPPYAVPEGGEDLHLVDLDGDTHLDLVWARKTAPSIWLGDGGRSWRELPPGTLPGYDFLELVPGDLDGDGDVDLVGSVAWTGPPTNSSGGVRVFLQEPGLRWVETTGAGPPDTHYVEALAVGDLDGDGDLDLAMSPFGYDAPQIELWLGRGDATFELAPPEWFHGIPPAGLGGVDDLLLEDADGDGRPELSSTSTLQGVRHFANVGVGVTLEALGGAAVGKDLPIRLESSHDAGRLYVAALSDGVSRGIPLGGGRRFPLDPSLLFRLSIVPGGGVLTGGRGILDASGEGTMTVSVPAHPALSGLRFFAAFAVLDPTAPSFVKTLSPALPIDIR